AEGGDGDRRRRRVEPQPKAALLLAGEQQPGRGDRVSKAAEAALPSTTVPGLDDDGRRHAQGQIDGSSAERRHRGDTESEGDGVAYGHGQRPDGDGDAGGAGGAGGAQGEGVERRHLPDL